MEDELIRLLETKKYPVFRQGSLTEKDAYPETFITFWNTEELGESFYDNGVALTSHSFDVNVYSSSPDTAYSLQRELRDMLKENGWTIQSRGYDVASDEPTYIGRGFAVIFLKNETI